MSSEFGERLKKFGAMSSEFGERLKKFGVGRQAGFGKTSRFIKMTEPKRVRMNFQGSVQGVGFRYVTVRLASPYAVTGYVRNIADGSVEVVAEGSKQMIQSFMEDIKREMESCIRKTQIDWSQATGDFKIFQVRY